MSRRAKVLRKLQGISYWVIEAPSDIAELVNTNIRREWEADIAEQEDHEEGRWLASLRKRKWELKMMKLNEIKLSDETMNSRNEKTGYDFRKRLEERVRLLERDIDRFGSVIRPLVVRAEDGQLMDGYCRYHTLKERGVTKTFAYVGGLRP